MIENIIVPGPNVRLFPPVENVFAEPLSLHQKHFLPLVSVNPAAIYPDLNLWLHFVTPIEPLLELEIGYFTEPFHDEYNREGQFAFNIDDGKYKFSGHWNYLAYESGAIFGAFPGRAEEIHADYRFRLQTYETARKAYEKTGRLYRPRYDGTYEMSRGSDIIVDQLGGRPQTMNCPTEPPRNRRGNPFRFIGAVDASNYCVGAAYLVLFFDPEERVALFWTDWT